MSEIVILAKLIVMGLAEEILYRLVVPKSMRKRDIQQKADHMSQYSHLLGLNEKTHSAE